MADQKVSVGRIVHFVLVDKSGATQHRPAIVVRVWPEQPGGPYEAEAEAGKHVVQLQVFTDGGNDGNENVLWMTSVHFDPSGAPGTWHWPERA